jgi:hypothetical protein
VTALALLVGIVAIMALSTKLPRVAAVMWFSFFATGCVQCSTNGDPFTGSLLLGYGMLIGMLMLDLGRMEQIAKKRAKAKQAPPEVMP